MDKSTKLLQEAILNDDYDYVDQLIRDTDVNQPQIIESNVTTLLHLAAESGKVQFVRFLMNRGANCNARDSNRHTPLHSAAMISDNSDIVKELISGGAILDAREKFQFTPLHAAVICKATTTAQELITRGASIEAVSYEGQNALHLASESGNFPMVKALMSYVINIDAEDCFGCTALHYAVRNTGITKILLENGADIEKKTLMGEFPLYRASKWGHRDTLRLLVKRGARINERTNTGMTALHQTCRLGLAYEAALLLKYGADINARNCEGKTAFEVLWFSKSIIARILIREAVKREAFGTSLCEEYKQMAQSCDNYSIFDQECREDVKRMRSEKIEVDDSAVSFFQIFVMNTEKLAVLARNQNIVAALETSNCRTSFKIYGGDLIEKFEMAKRRSDFLMSVEDCLVDVFGDILPAPIMQKIAAHVKYDYMTENEL